MPGMSPNGLIKNLDIVKCKIVTDTGTSLFTDASYYSDLPALRNWEANERTVTNELKWRNEK